jgi:hypothetical protein
MKISGVETVESLKELSKSKVGGSINSAPRLAVMKSCIAATTLSGLKENCQQCGTRKLLSSKYRKQRSTSNFWKAFNCSSQGEGSSCLCGFWLS